tara:strand:+ start:271 stop:1443 length:1173 start_codon:yes stop_codon:yes gene_type:complete
MTKGDIIREVAFEVDDFELKHYNEELKGCFERVQEYLDDVRDTVEDVADPRFVESERLKKLKEAPYDVGAALANANAEIDQMESIGVQNGLVRSKHLHNLLQAARFRNSKDYYHYRDPNVDHVSVKIPWYLVDNLLEKLYLKYHKTRIHKCFDIVHKYLLEDDYEKEDSYRGIYVFWKEVQELWEEIFDEETLSNHYHNDDNYWQYDIDPKDCKNLKDFFRKRIKVKINEKEQEEERLKKQAILEKQKLEELKKLQSKEHKLRKYIPLEKYSETIEGSVYWFIDINNIFQKNKNGILYVGESSNFNSRYNSYKPKNSGRLTELEQKLQLKFPGKEEEIKKFVRDEKLCALRVVSYNFLKDNRKRKKYESRIIKIVNPLLNRGNLFSFKNR